MKQKLTILFDLDGTLVDTAPDLVNAHRHVMKKFGFATKAAEDIKKLVGKGAKSLIYNSIYDPIKGKDEIFTDEKTKEEMVKEYLDYYGKNINIESKLIEGVTSFLDWCKSNSLSMGVCTYKQEHLAIDLLKKIKIYDYFEFVAGSNTFDYCKPDPRHLTTVLEIMDGSIEKSIMIGDSETDANTAYNCNMKFILLEDGYTEKKVSEIHHDYLIKNFIGLDKIINKYLDD